jgi:hypothetical protein
MYDDIAEETGYADRTLRLVKETAEKIESGRRLPELSFSHHVEVASLPPEKQEAVAEIVGVDRLVVTRLIDGVQKRHLSEMNKDFKPFIYNIKKPPVVVALFLRSCDNRKQE